MLTPSDDRELDLEALLRRRPEVEVEWGLERVRELLVRLGRPERSFRAYHVGGTNGKGSCAACMAGVLRASGLRTGLYTSPDLTDVRDRVRIDGEPVDRDLAERGARALARHAEEVGSTFFETVTALAFHLFRQAGVEAAAVEVGLGGRLDATNVLEPAAVAITSVSRDHADYLGDSLEGIAAEKAGILKPGVPAALGPLSEDIAEVIAELAREVGAPLARLGHDARVTDVVLGDDGTRFRYRSARSPEPVSLRVPLVGRHQASNAGVALLALEMAGDLPATEIVREGLARVRWRGRFETIDAPDGRWILDIAHNTAGIESLVATLRELSPPRPWVFLVAVLGDKPWREMLAPLAEPADATIFTVAPGAPPERRWDPEEARRSLPDLAPRVEPDFDAALRTARELAGGGTVLVTGSSYTVGDALARSLERVAAREDEGRVAGSSTEA